MSDPGMSAAAWAIVATALLAAVTVVAVALLKGWRAWIDLQRLGLERGRSGPAATGAGARIELADLRERIRKLEAIASGVEW